MTLETTIGLPVIDISVYLQNPTSQEALLECTRAANAIELYSALSIKDPRVTETQNAQFLDLLEDYFDQPDAIKMKDARPELFFQVGATPENTELPRCGRDEKCLHYVDSLDAEDKPLDFNQKDPKWRFFWRIGSTPSNTKFKQLNAESVQPGAFPQWKIEMDTWGYRMLDGVKILSEMLAIGFGLPVDTFTNLLENGPHLLAPTGSDLNKYGKVGRVLAGFHTDLNFLTIHGKSRFPGLHVWTKQGKKLIVYIPDGCLLVQAGKQMEWLTGGTIKAGFHEVVVTPATLGAIQRQSDNKRPLWRISSTLFAHIASDHILKPVGHFQSQTLACEYPPIEAGKQVEEELGLISLKV